MVGKIIHEGDSSELFPAAQNVCPQSENSLRMLVEQAAKLSIQQGPPRSGPGAPRRQPSHNVAQLLDKKPHFLGKSPKDRDCIVCSNSRLLL